MSAPAPLPQRVEKDLFQRATWLAATLGPFDPAELVGHLTQEPAERRTLFVALAPLCSEISLGDTVLWSLDADPRRRALGEMQSEGLFARPGLPDFIASLPVAPDDRFGRYLRDALAGNANPESGDPQDIDAQYSAYEFVARAAAGNTPEQMRNFAELVEQRAQRIAAEERLAQAVGPAFVGRVAELEALREFALTGVVGDPRFGISPSPQAHVSPMAFVSGISGAGKSALISKFVQRLRQQSSLLAATIILDFDRPTLSSLDRVQLSIEVIRQIALSHPQLAGDLTYLRRTALSEFSDVELASASDEANFRLDLRALYSIHQRLQAILLGAGLTGRPFVIILDTFEEVMTLGGPFVEAIYQWLEELRAVAGLSKLRIVVSGRAVLPDRDDEPRAPADSMPAEYANVVAKIHLRDLPPNEAITLLSLRGIERVFAIPLVERFGSNPLVLRLLGDYAAQKGARAVHSLLRGGKTSRQYRAEVAQRILYSRILGRIRHEPAVKALASPGLIVRLVTPGVIRVVLAGPCGLGQIDTNRAIELFDKLASQVWLVRRIGPRAVAHRRDLRTLMLPLSTEPKGGETAASLARQIKKIHRNALAYYRHERDPDLSPTACRNEEIYHELFLEPEPALARPDLRSAFPSLAVDIEDFPVPLRAELKRRAGRSLTREEFQTLQTGRDREYEGAVTSQRTRSTGRSVPRPRTPSPELAGDASRSAPRPEIVAFEAASPLPATQAPLIIDAFAEAQFEDIARVSHEILDLFLSRVSSKDDLAGLQPDMSNHVSWIAALSTLAVRSDGDCTALSRHWLENFCNRADQSWRWLRLRRIEDRSQLAATHYVAAIAILLNRGRALDSGVRQLLHRVHQDAGGGGLAFELTSTISLRIFQLFVTVLENTRLELRPRAVSLNVLQYFAGLLDPAFAQKRDSSMHAAQRAWQQKIKEGALPSAINVLLGKDPNTINTSELAYVERGVGEQRVDLYDWSASDAGSVRRGRDKQSGLNLVHLRGMATDLQAPALAVVRQRFRDRSDSTQLLRNLDQASKWWPRDLRFGDGAQGVQPGDSRLTALCHYVDRFAMMPLLFRGAKTATVGWRVGCVYSTYAEFLSTRRKSEDAR